jgi:hypothetical protein
LDWDGPAANSQYVPLTGIGWLTQRINDIAFGVDQDWNDNGERKAVPERELPRLKSPIDWRIRIQNAAIIWRPLP